MTNTVTDKMFREGFALHQAGRLAEARALYLQVLQKQPAHFDCLNLLGVIQLQSGFADQAVRLVGEALKLNTTQPSAWFNRGNALLALQRFAEAVADFDRALALNVGFIEARLTRAQALLALQRPADALTDYDDALARKPDYFPGWNNRAVALLELQRYAEALASCERALALQPAYADALCNRGNAQRQLGRLDEALASYDSALALQPASPQALTNRGAVLQSLGRLTDALACLDDVVTRYPGHAHGWNCRGVTLQALGRPHEAVADYDKAVALDPRHAEACNNRSVSLLALKRADAALASCEQALALRPDYAEAWCNRGDALRELLRREEAEASYAKAFSLKPDCDFLLGSWLHVRMQLCDWQAFDALLAALQDGIRAGRRVTSPFPVLALFDDPPLHLAATALWCRTHHPRRGRAPRPAAADKLRIGYYSADFHDHATAWLMAELFEAHDHERFDLHAFSFGPDRQDAMRTRLVAAFDHFTDVSHLDDDAVAQLSREHGIDIAIDLKGHTQNARVGLFAAGCAPLQVSFLGYPGTMAADYYDYVIADNVVLPPSQQPAFTEHAVCLPPSYQVNDSQRRISDRAFTRAEAGLPAQGVVFCCFNNNYKILPATFAVWMRILHAVPDSVLWLLEDNATAAANLRREAVARGIDAGRLVFAQRLPLAEHLARQRLADLFLDTWPCNAHTTASDALWAGLPLLTCAGQSFASRVAASLLTAIGLPELIAVSPADYERLAITLAQEPAQLDALKARLAAQRLTSPLFDGRRYARRLEAALEAMHARLASGLPPAAMDLETMQA